MSTEICNNDREKLIVAGNNILFTLIAILCVSYVLLVPKININWDEFLYLSKIYNYESGRSLSAIQTIYIHFFGWLRNIPGNEVSQIIAARYVYLGIFFVCLFVIYTISRRMSSKTGAFFTVFLILSYTDVIRHGYSFRADLLCVFLFLIAILFLFNNKLPIIILSSLSISLCFLVSIKAIFYIPTLLFIILIFILNRENKAETIKSVCVFIVLSLLFTIVLYYTHAYLVSQNISAFSEIAEQSQKKIVSSGRKVFWTGQFFPRRFYIERSLVENVANWFVIFAGIVFIAKRFFIQRFCDTECALIGFSLPLFSLLFYRNAFPYYFVFLIPFGLLIANAYINELLKYLKKRRKLFAICLFFVPVIFSSLSAAKIVLSLGTDKTIAQREILDVVHRMYPMPVPYIDRNRMISSFPNVGFWMSTWGLEEYRQQGLPVMQTILQKEQPQLLIANSPVLQIYSNKWFGENKSVYRLLDEDYLTLRNNFIPHWGLIYIPGKYFQFGSTEKERLFDIIIEGQYTVECKDIVSIDGKILETGRVVYIEKGEHLINGMENATVILRWGNHLYRPDKLPVNAPIYTGL
jgi:hypothetical protein